MNTLLCVLSVTVSTQTSKNGDVCVWEEKRERDAALTRWYDNNENAEERMWHTKAKVICEKPESLTHT